MKTMHNNEYEALRNNSHLQNRALFYFVHKVNNKISNKNKQQV